MGLEPEMMNCPHCDFGTVPLPTSPPLASRPKQKYLTGTTGITCPNCSGTGKIPITIEEKAIRLKATRRSAGAPRIALPKGIDKKDE